MFDYADLASTVSELIEEFGARAILNRTIDADYNATSSEVESSDRASAGRAVRVEYELKDIDGEMIRRGDVRLYVSVATETGAEMPEPQNGDRITFDGTIWRVIACSPIKSATVAVAYDVQARK